MNIIYYSSLTYLLFFSSVTLADIFKCKDEKGKLSYQSEPCADTDSSSFVKIEASSKINDNSKQSLKATGPSGRWLNKTNMTANLSQSGLFQMTDISGGILTGSWKVSENGNYSVSAKYNGVSIPVKMEYDNANDILFLSKPGSPDSLLKYNRSNILN